MQLEEMTQRINTYQVIEGSSTTLGEIIKGQQNYSSKFGLGFEKGKSSIMLVIENTIVFKKEEKKPVKEYARQERNIDDGFTKFQHQRRR